MVPLIALAVADGGNILSCDRFKDGAEKPRD
jgi:hypothetical protein